MQGQHGRFRVVGLALVLVLALALAMLPAACDAVVTCASDLDCDGSTCTAGECPSLVASHSTCRADAVEVTEAVLRGLTGNDCGDCAAMAPHVNAAALEATMACPKRLAALVAQIRHETQGFTQMRHPTLMRAGGVMLPVAALRLACSQLPAMYGAFETEFASCNDVATDPCSCGTEEQVVDLAALPQWAIRIAAWYLSAGAAAAPPTIGLTCGDLRSTAMDDGAGTWQGWVSTAFPGTGFHKVSSCIAGVAAADTGRADRMDNYILARRYFDNTYAPTCDGDTLAGGALCGALCPLKCDTGVACAAHGDCVSGRCSETFTCASGHEACDASKVSLSSAAQLTGLMGGTCSNCGSLLIPFQAAAAEYHMECKLRLAAFAAVVRKGTSALTSFSREEPAGSGEWTAGAVPLTTQHQRLACAAVSGLSDAFATEFDTCPTAGSNPCACGTSAEVAAIIALPQWAFRVAAWYMAEGATAAHGEPCGDLRFDADDGAGGYEGWVSRNFPGSGFFKVATCVYGFQLFADPALRQRVDYFVDAMRFLQPSYAPRCPSASGANDDESTAACGTNCPLLCPGDASCNAHQDCISGACFDRQCVASSVVTSAGGVPGAGAAPHFACAGAATTLTAAQLRSIMGNSCTIACDTAVTHLNDAFSSLHMNCPTRIASALVEVKQRTSGLASMLDVDAEDGTPEPRGGAFMLAADDLRGACKVLPDFEAAMNGESFASTCNQTTVCDCGSDTEVATIAARPELAFQTAAWWFAAGAAVRVSVVCADLRLQADIGPGVAVEVPDDLTAGSGNAAVRACMSNLWEDVEGGVTAVDQWPLIDSYQAIRDVIAGGSGDGAAYSIACDNSLFPAGCGRACQVRCGTDDGCTSHTDCANGLCLHGRCAAESAPASPDLCPSGAIQVTTETLRAMSGGNCPDAVCVDALPHIAAAMSNHGLICETRATAFWAQVRHETAQFTAFVQPIDDGAGSMHMLPDNARIACRELPALKAAFAADFASSGCATINSDPCACGTDVQVSHILERPEHAYATGAWWFSRGASFIMGPPCGDLRLHADVGRGIIPQGAVTRNNGGSGYELITSCIYGFRHDPGRWQRGVYYGEATAGLNMTKSCDCGSETFGVCLGNDLFATCSACSTCSGSEFMEAACTPTIDAVCTPCTDCEALGKITQTACSSTADAVCIKGPDCVDGSHNGDETDVDCGGADCAPCTAGKTCVVDGDCANSHTCKAGICASNLVVGSSCAIGLSCASAFCHNAKCTACVNGAPSEDGSACVCSSPHEWRGASCNVEGCGELGFENKQTGECSCTPGRTGTDCSSVAECSHGDWSPAGTCLCHVGYTGEACNNLVPSVTCLHGIYDAVNSKCLCNPGFEGATCDSVVPLAPPEAGFESSYCIGHGSWDAQSAQCVCDSALWTGPLCTQYACVYGTGTLTTEGAVTCTCVPGYTGAKCDTSCRGLCSDNGNTCAAGLTENECLCDLGYSGERCENKALVMGSSTTFVGGGLRVRVGVQQGTSPSEADLPMVFVAADGTACANMALTDAACLPLSVTVQAPARRRASSGRALAALAAPVDLTLLVPTSALASFAAEDRANVALVLVDAVTGVAAPVCSLGTVSTGVAVALRTYPVTLCSSGKYHMRLEKGSASNSNTGSGSNAGSDTSSGSGSATGSTGGAQEETGTPNADPSLDSTSVSIGLVVAIVGGVLLCAVAAVCIAVVVMRRNSRNARQAAYFRGNSAASDAWGDNSGGSGFKSKGSWLGDGRSRSGRVYPINSSSGGKRVVTRVTPMPPNSLDVLPDVIEVDEPEESDSDSFGRSEAAAAKAGAAAARSPGGSILDAGVQVVGAPTLAPPLPEGLEDFSAATPENEEAKHHEDDGDDSTPGPLVAGPSWTANGRSRPSSASNTPAGESGSGAGAGSGSGSGSGSGASASPSRPGSSVSSGSAGRRRSSSRRSSGDEGNPSAPRDSVVAAAAAIATTPPPPQVVPSADTVDLPEPPSATLGASTTIQDIEDVDETTL